LDRPDRERIVWDTNVLVSAVLFPRSIPGQALRRAREMGVLLATRELVMELRAVLARPKFDRYLTAEVRDEFLAAYVVEAEFVPVTEHITVCCDPKDDQVVDAAINGRATYVISGDEDLLVLTPCRGIPILRPADFLARCGMPTT
jgi:putative PIN family toxin of toxin-antitoxin system